MRLGHGALVLALTASVATAQTRVSVRGRVVDSLTGANLAFSSVLLYPGFPERFTDYAGGFVFPDVAPGRYRLRVRQIGYLPHDVAVPVGDTGEVVLRIALQRLVIQLPPVTVVARAGCETPGPPDPMTAPELAVIFDQLRENAARYRLLADAYPFKYWLARVHRTEGRGGEERVVLVDTLEYVSNAGWRYAPGRLITTEQRGRGGRERVMNIPELGDLADTAFHNAHCFSYAGLDTLEGRTHFRVEFLAASRLRTPDVDGTAWLDTATFQVQRLTLRLTRVDRAAAGVKELEATADFAEVVPAVIVPARVTAVTTMTPAAARRGLLRRYEVQRLVRVEFLRPLPQGPSGRAP